MSVTFIHGQAVAIVYDNECTPIVVTNDNGLVKIWQDTDLVFVPNVEELIKALREAKKIKP